MDSPLEKEALQISAYTSIQNALANTSPSYELYRQMASYITTYGNKKPSSMQLEGQTDAFTTEQVAKAYYASDAYAARARRSLGYAPNERMTPADKAIYDRIIERGKYACEIYVEYTDLLRDSESYFNDMDDVINDPETAELFKGFEKYVATIGTKPAPEGAAQTDSLGMDTLGHEMGHFLYSGNNDNKSLNPGSPTKTNYIGNKEQTYGKPGSPLRTIDASPSRTATLRTNLKAFAEECTADEKAEMQKDDYRAAIKSSREHDDTGMERGADVHGVRLLMMQDGIWNYFSGKRVTLPQVLQFKKEHPTSRIFQYWTPQQVVYYLNNLAMEQNKAQGINYADLASTNYERLEKQMEKEQTHSLHRT